MTADRIAALPIVLLVLLGACGTSEFDPRPAPAQVALSAGGLGGDVGTSVAGYPDGSVVVVGYFDETMSFPDPAGAGAPPLELPLERAWGCFVARYGQKGDLIWARSIGTRETRFTDGLLRPAVAAVEDGACLVAGRFEGTADFGDGVQATATGDYEGFVARYEADGTLGWLATVPNANTNAGGLALESLAGFADGSSVVCGNFTGTVWFDGVALFPTGRYNSFVARFDPVGRVLWARLVAGVGDNHARHVASCRDGSVLVSGYFVDQAIFGDGAVVLDREPGTVNGLFLARFDAAGELLWARRAEGGSNDGDYGLATFPDGSCLFTGRYAGTATFGRGEPQETTLASLAGSDAFLARYDPDGALAWARGIRGTEWMTLYATAALGDGSVVVGGTMYGSATFGSRARSVRLASADSGDVFLARYDPRGRLAWAQSVPGAGIDEARAVAALPDGTLAVTGGFSQDATFAPTGALNARGGLDMFLVFYGP